MNLPPSFYIRACLLILCFISDYKYISSKRGKQLILHKEYTFNFTKSTPTKNTSYWQCTGQANNKCKAKLILDAHGNIISGQTDHSHPPPQFFVKDGEYIRIYNKQLRYYSVV